MNAIKAAQAQLTAAKQAHATARSPWARFRCRCAVLAAEGRLQAALEAQEAWAYRVPSYTRPAVVVDARGRTWDRDAVNALIKSASTAQRQRMLRAIAQRHQENAAQGLTRDDNGRGFFAFEAEHLLVLAAEPRLTWWEAEELPRALRRYAGQLLEVIGERASAV